MSLIPADNHLAVMAALFTIAAVAFLLEKTRIGALVTGTVSAIFIAILAANLRIIPSSAPAYDFVWTYFVPVLIPLFLMKADLKRIFFETTRMAAARAGARGGARAPSPPGASTPRAHARAAGAAGA